MGKQTLRSMSLSHPAAMLLNLGFLDQCDAAILGPSVIRKERRLRRMGSISISYFALSQGHGALVLMILNCA